MKQFIVLLSMVSISLTSAASWYADIPKDGEVIKVHGENGGDYLKEGVTYSMLVWNIFKHKRRGLVEDLSFLTGRSDFVLLQESMVDRVMRPFFQAKLGMEWISAASFYTDGGTTGVASGSRFYVSGSSFTRSKVKEPIVLTPKMIVYTEYPTEGGQTLLVANIHGINFVSTASFKVQITQLYDVVRNHKGPLIVAGDFNSRNQERWRVLYQFSRKLSLRKVRLSNEKEKYPIDAILTRNVKIESGEILRRYESSDHKPLWLQFHL